ncbi:DUF2628 domain-containing protein [Shewanella sp. Scap07]|uniref:DUF2628 domain-containing protein n=1 Tax=Shewanella sp. Scap07 TaxID=2589987 RepID=UPI0015B855C7|nr:DUF2628 domain-containing protein [Shewanella sp. Scap07]QLE84296.1 DUF2628 domain-containing protein [Shewanella sp. Scap07]
MSDRVIFRNKFSGKLKEVKLGFSWTTFFFMYFPDFFRGNFKTGGIYFAVWLGWVAISCTPDLEIMASIVGLIGCIVWSFHRNRFLAKHYDLEGWELVVGDKDRVKAYIGRELYSIK